MNLTPEQQIHNFDEVNSVLANDERFKAKLGIGHEAFTSLKVGKYASQLWNIGGAVGTGASVAASGTIASTFFGTLWTSVGVATAFTPIGWVIGAAVVSGGACYGVSRLFKSYSDSRIDEIPKFLNTGLDVLATSTLDLLGSLALKVAAIDSEIDASELSSMQEYFVEEWGYDPLYVEHALEVLQQNIDKSSLSDMTASLAEFIRANPDCNSKDIQAELRKLLIEVAEADGHLDEREEMAIERIENSLREQNSLLVSTGRLLSSAAASAGNSAGSTAETFSQSATLVITVATNVARSTAGAASGATSAMSSLAGKLWPKK